MRSILYTGARSGIAASVIEKIKSNYKIYVAVHTIEELKSIKKIYSNETNIICLKLDITNNKDLEKISDLDIDILINHAGIGIGGSILDVPIEEVKRNYEVNVFSSFKLLQIVARKMINKKHGKIIITSSLISLTPIPFLGIYASTKASISMLAKTLQKELKIINNPIDIVLIEPGIYNTGFNEVMLDNKDKYKRNSIFKFKMKEIDNKQHLFFKLFGKNNYNSIVKKIVKAINSKRPKKVYRAPFFQAVGAKILNLFQ